MLEDAGLFGFLDDIKWLLENVGLFEKLPALLHLARQIKILEMYF